MESKMKRNANNQQCFLRSRTPETQDSPTPIIRLKLCQKDHSYAKRKNSLSGEGSANPKYRHNMLHPESAHHDELTGSQNLTAFFNTGSSFNNSQSSFKLSIDDSLILSKSEGKAPKKSQFQFMMTKIIQSRTELKYLEKQVLQIVLFAEQFIHNFKKAFEKANNLYQQQRKNWEKQKNILLNLNKDLSSQVQCMKIKNEALETSLYEKSILNRKLLKTIQLEEKFITSMHERISKGDKLQNIENLFQKQQQFLSKQSKQIQMEFQPVITFNRSNTMRERNSPLKTITKIHSIQRRGSEQVEKSTKLLCPKMEKNIENQSQTTNGSSKDKKSGLKLKRKNTGPESEVKQFKKILNLQRSQQASDMKSQTSDKSQIQQRIQSMRARIVAMKKGLENSMNNNYVLQ